MSWQGLHHMQLCAPPGCEAAARAFFGGLLGLPELPKPETLNDGGVWFAIGGQEVHVGVDSDFRPAARAHPALACTAMDAMAERLAAAGYEVAWDDRIPGRRRFFTRDPFGNRIEILEASGN